MYLILLKLGYELQGIQYTSNIQIKHMHPIKHHLWQIKTCLFSKTKVKLNVKDVAVQGRCKRLHMPKESNFLWSWCWYSYLIPDHMQSKATGHSITVTASYSTMPLLLPYLHTTMRHKAQMGTSIVTWHRTSFFKKMFTVDECWKWMKRLQNQKYTTLPLSLSQTHAYVHLCPPPSILQ